MTMRRHEFTLFLSGLAKITDEAANALFEAGCDDASPASCDGVVWMTFHREADSLDAAVRSAMADVQKAGFQVERLEIERGAFDELVAVVS
jgi:hypothetical protein